MKGRQNAAALWSLWFTGLCISLASVCVQADQQQSDPQSSNDNTMHWLQRIEQAAQQRDFSGTYVVVQPDRLYALHTVHANVDGKQYDLVTKLDGQERQIFKDGSALYAVFPQTKQIILERQSVIQMFPGILKTHYAQLGHFYKINELAQERTIGRMASVLQMMPQDEWRFGYKIWVDQATGLLLRIQVMDAQGKVLERVAFTDISFELSELQKKELSSYIETLKGQAYQLHELHYTDTTPQAEGWELQQQIPGFEPISCVLRPLPDSDQQLIQWVFSDGLVSVSIFIEPMDEHAQREARDYSYGATHSVSFRRGQWWVTLVGEVPAGTLALFEQSLEHTPG